MEEKTGVDVVYLAKVQISKQITTANPIVRRTALMLFTLQRYKFLSKSQQRTTQQLYGWDVVYLAKVQISKQITTQRDIFVKMEKMLFTLQRYKFLSKSQLTCSGIISEQDVVYLAKVQISKQITTKRLIMLFIRRMLFTLQRYKFLSKSQLVSMC